MSIPNKEAMKEIARWLILFIISWIISEIIRQANLIPESFSIKIYLLTFIVPIRTLFVFGLTMLGRYIDKYKHISGKESKTYPVGMTPSSGILPF